MSVHYKFKSALEYDTVTFDGLHISVKDLKNSILQQKRIGKSTDFDLQVTNAQTKEVYEDENTLIPKNTSLLIARIPVLVQKNKPWEGYGGDSTPPPKSDEGGPIAKAVDLASLDAPEDDKIKAMMSQSTQEYDPSNYVKIRGSNQVGAVPPNYRCYKCHQGGHWIKDCTFGQGPDPIEIKKSTGIPRNFLVPVDGPQVPGAMMTPNGQYAVPMLDLQAYNQKGTPAPVPAPKIEIPEDLICSICHDLLADAVMIPCCGNSFCDECIRGVLLDSEEHECPDCHEKDISPDTLIPNRFLRTSVANFRNTTGYVKKPTYRERIDQDKPRITSTKERTPPHEQESADKLNVDEKTVISEADSTEHTRNDDDKDTDPVKAKDAKDSSKGKESGYTPEGPPGVSPKGSPGRSPKERERPIRRLRTSRDSKERTRRNSHGSRHRDDSPRKGSRNLRSPSYSSPASREERSGTPTVDEPTNGVNYPSTYGNTVPAVPSGPVPVPSIIGQIPPIQGPPPHGMPTTFPPGQPPLGTFPPNQGPMPNYRLPPPGSAPFMGPGPFPIPPRAMFDGSRPPIGGFPPNFNPNVPPGSRAHRDFNRRRDRTPPGLIDDPLAAFNRMLREKDERKRRAKRRSYSRSRSRSRSFSRSPVRRRNSRSPRPSRRSRSRSRSFSLSRSRSRSYTVSPRGSPYNNRQASSPARRSPLVTRRGPPLSRFRSPPPTRPSRSPPPRTRHPADRHRDFEDDRDYPDRDRTYKDRIRDRGRNSRDRRPSSRDRDRYFDNFDDRSSGNRGEAAWQQNRSQTIQDNYYPPSADIQQGYQTRFGQGPRDYAPPYMNKEPPIYGHPIPPAPRQFQDIKPPGVDDDIAPPGVDEPPPQPLQKLSPKRDEKDRDKDKERERLRSRDRRERSAERDRKRRHERKSRTPDRARNPSPKKKSKSRDRDSPDKHKRRRKDSSDREDRKRDHSEDEKSKKSRDKKKHKDRKESEKKKKRDKKDKHKKESKEKKPKEEFKQVIPKKREADSEEEAGQKEKRKGSRERGKDDVRRRSEEKVYKDKTEEKMEVEDTSIKEEIESAKKIKKEVRVKKSKDPDVKQTLKDVKKKEKLEVKEEEEHVTSTTPARVDIGDLYGDISHEDIDTKVIENYGRIEEEKLEDALEDKSTQDDEGIEEGEIKEFEEEDEEEEGEEKDVLELHLNDIDLKTELEKSDILAPVPEKSKWEVEEDILTSPRDSSKSDLKIDKSGKVTNEVLKRAENAIFAKAIKAIRPLEMKKREVEKSNNKLQVTVASVIDTPAPAPQRLSVKERLGVKVDEPEKVINLSSRNRSRSVSPFSRRGEGGRNFDANDRRVELESARKRRIGRNRSRSRGRDHSRDRRVRLECRTHIRDIRTHGTHGRDKHKKEERTRHEDDRKSRRKRTRSRSESEEKKDKHKKRDKKQKKEKPRKGKEEDDHKSDKDGKDESKPTAVTKRKPTIDEATFEPDYDLESHSEEEEETSIKKKASKKQSEDEEEKSSSSESDSDSSSEDDRKKKKHKKHKKRKKKESSSSSSSDSESESSDSDRGKKKRKHKKNKKKKKKTKHK